MQSCVETPCQKKKKKRIEMKMTKGGEATGERSGVGWNNNTNLDPEPRSSEPSSRHFRIDVNFPSE